MNAASDWFYLNPEPPVGPVFKARYPIYRSWFLGCNTYFLEPGHIVLYKLCIGIRVKDLLQRIKIKFFFLTWNIYLACDQKQVTTRMLQGLI